jgi:hypothetical protein
MITELKLQTWTAHLGNLWESEAGHTGPDIPSDRAWLLIDIRPAGRDSYQSKRSRRLISSSNKTNN